MVSNLLWCGIKQDGLNLSVSVKILKAVFVCVCECMCVWRGGGRLLYIYGMCRFILVG